MIAQIQQLVLHELASAFRTKRVLISALLFVSASVVAGLIAAAALSAAEDAIVERASQDGVISEDDIREMLRTEAATWAEDALEGLGVEIDDIAEPVKTSLVAPATFWAALTFLPFLVLLTTSDLVSSELRVRSLCYSTLRTPRWALIVSKLLAGWLVVVGLSALAVFVVLGLAARAVDALPMADALLSATWIAASLVPYAFAWTAVSIACSTLSDRPIGALVRGALAMVLFAVAQLPYVAIAEDAPLAPLRGLRYLAPKANTSGLWHAPDAAWALSIITLFVFGAVFTGLAVARLQRRDL